MNWTSDENVILLNPRLPENEKSKIQSLLPLTDSFKKHIWMATSGTTVNFKLVGLKKEAILASAQAVNKHLEATSKDVWFNPLPEFHVGGLGIWARAYLVGGKVIPFEQKWNANAFSTLVNQHKATLSALVPTQVFDLVSQKIKAPHCLRAIIVGGGALSEHLYQEAKNLGWPLLPSYGMTECASQIATATVTDHRLQLLSHLQVKVDETSRICVKGDSLFTVYLDGNGISDPKIDGWFTTSDLGILEGKILKMLGRADDFVKISGELVSIPRLEEILSNIQLKHQQQIDMAIVALPDARLGFAIHLVTTEKGLHFENILREYQNLVLPFETIRQIHLLDKIPRTSLNKVRKEILIQSFKM